jgi:hypothetical protein
VDLSSSRHHSSGRFEPVSVRQDAKNCALLLTFVTGSNIYSAFMAQRELSEKIWDLLPYLPTMSNTEQIVASAAAMLSYAATTNVRLVSLECDARESFASLAFITVHASPTR